jgi:hypothetical protein
MMRHQDRTSRFGFDYPPRLRTPGPMASRDTHFSFPLGEMTIFLDDVGLLFGLPCAGDAMWAADVTPLMFLNSK